MTLNTRVVLAGRPSGWVEASHFRIEQAPLPEPGPGEVLVRNLYLSLDPYMRGRMSDARSYAAPVAIGEVMVGGTVGEVLASNHPKLQPGDHVVGRLGWQTHATAPAAEVQKVDPAYVPLSTYLGCVGMPGATAWMGLLEYCQPRAGETVLVSAATGAVGSVVGQLAKLQGCRAVGIAGGPRKCEHAVRDLGFDACVDYRAGNLSAQLRAAAPQGVDCYFENVGGEVMDAAFGQLNAYARVALCGLIADYNLTEPYGMRMIRALLVNRVRLQGFIVLDRMDLYVRAIAQLGRLVHEGRLTYRETIAEGIEQAPGAFIGMLRGENLGKQLVKLA